ncbi:MAG TPA: N-methyl-L-tryptophan oxidase, partial [Gemmatimonadaceae bacterium]|nr:N-methyl-L-tryptophan oxidase [Gemmatimonadaceae bacterium]
RGTLRSAQDHELAHEVLAPSALHRRFPAFSPLDDMVGVLEHRAGILLPEAIVQAHLELAAHHGATLRVDTRIDGWDQGAGCVAIRIGGETVRARQLVVAAGVSIGELLPELQPLLTVERRTIHWFEPVRFPEYFTPERMPVSLWELEDGTLFYTKPDLGDGVKIGIHHGGEAAHRRRSGASAHDAADEEDAEVYDLLRRFVPFAKGHQRERATCRYTMAPDAHFIIDRHPAADNVLILSPCSGHGFKFASVIGELAADLLTTGGCAFELSPFSIRRFSAWA